MRLKKAVSVPNATATISIFKKHLPYKNKPQCNKLPYHSQEMTFLSRIYVIHNPNPYTSSTSPARNHRISCGASKPWGVRASNCRISAMMSSVSDGLVWVM